MSFKDWFSNHILDIGGKKPDAQAPTTPATPDAVAMKAGEKTIGDIAAQTPKPTFDKPIEKPKNSPTVTFTQIFEAANIAPPPHGFTIYKVADMLASDRLKNMTPENKAAAVMVAVEAGGAKLEDVVRDAVARDKALDAFEEFQERRLADLRKAKEEENKKLKEEVKAFVNQKRAQFQKNRQAVAALEEEINNWREVKRQEEERIHDAIGHFVAQNPITKGKVYTVVGAAATPDQPPPLPGAKPV